MMVVFSFPVEVDEEKEPWIPQKQPCNIGKKRKTTHYSNKC